MCCYGHSSFIHLRTKKSLISRPWFTLMGMYEAEYIDKKRDFLSHQSLFAEHISNVATSIRHNIRSIS